MQLVGDSLVFSTKAGGIIVFSNYETVIREIAATEDEQCFYENDIRDVDSLGDERGLILSCNTRVIDPDVDGHQYSSLGPRTFAQNYRIVAYGNRFAICMVRCILPYSSRRIELTLPRRTTHSPSWTLQICRSAATCHSTLSAATSTARCETTA